MQLRQNGNIGYVKHVSQPGRVLSVRHARIHSGRNGVWSQAAGAGVAPLLLGGGCGGRDGVLLGVELGVIVGVRLGTIDG